MCLTMPTIDRYPPAASRASLMEIPATLARNIRRASSSSARANTTWDFPSIAGSTASIRRCSSLTDLRGKVLLRRGSSGPGIAGPRASGLHRSPVASGDAGQPLFYVLEGGRRSGPVADPVGIGPLHLPVRVPAHRPSVLVHQLVVGAAQQEQVVQIGPSAPRPPHQVVGHGEPPGAAAGEPALDIPVPEGPDHGRGGPPGQPPEGKGRPVRLLHLDREPGRA